MVIEIYMPAVLVCLITFLATAYVSVKFCGNIKKSVNQLKSVVVTMKHMAPCYMENLEILEESMSKLRDKTVLEAWKNFCQDTSMLLGGKITPEPKAYFNYKDIYAVPRGEKEFSALWTVLFALGVFVFCLTPAILLIGRLNMEQLPFAIGVSLGCVGFIAMVFAVFFVYSRKTADYAERELALFVRGLETVLPVGSIGAQTGLLLEGTRQNNLAFEKTSKDIGDKIDNFAVKGITPIVARSFRDAIAQHLEPSMNLMETNLSELSTAVVERQEEGMRALADTFADRLTNTIDGRINSMCENVDKINGSMKELENNMNNSISTLEASLQADRGALTEAFERIKEAAEIQKNASENISVLSRHLETTGKLVETLNNWDGLIEKSSNAIADSLRSAVESNAETTRNLVSTMESVANAETEQHEKASQAATQFLNDIILEMNKVLDGVGREIMGSITTASTDIEKSSNTIANSLRAAVESNVETAKGLAGTMESLANAGTEQYEKAAEAAAQFLNDVIIEMNKAMDGVGHEIAESITKASSDSVIIIDRLAEKTGQLKEEYDTYFSRVENQSRASMDDMDFHVQSVIGRFSEDAMVVMNKLEENITKAMGMFEGNTTELLSSLDEQSRSIGLYAHDLNIDIADLSVNLKESVKIFTDQIQGGVERTFQDFDEGLSEVSGRLANTVESIRESVENLPKALRDGK
ncbi:MAG: hypothetical protein JJE49_08330 [Peptostreptococcaceae bacterium]|nr:hypothetical protein [Peptostreptococcaceae bacterium]